MIHNANIQYNKASVVSLISLVKHEGLGVNCDYVEGGALLQVTEKLIYCCLYPLLAGDMEKQNFFTSLAGGGYWQRCGEEIISNSILSTTIVKSKMEW